MRPLALSSRPRRRKFVLTSYEEYEVPDVTELEQPAHQRIQGVVPLLVKQIKRWLERVPPRERSQYDIDDILQAMWAELIKKDKHYDPGRAEYTTFSSMLLDRFLCDLRNHCHMVKSPRDTVARLDGRRSESAQTIERIRQSIRNVDTIGPDMLDEGIDPTFDSAASNDMGTVSWYAVRDAVMQLSDVIRTLTWTFGLFDSEPLPIPIQAERTGSTVADIIQTLNEAMRKVAKTIVDRAPTPVSL
jgi:hypothetical protein